MRDSEDEWAESITNQLRKKSTPYIVLMSYLSPTFQTFWKYLQMTCR